MRGKFITVEGGEGAGKTSNIQFIRNQIESTGKTVIVTREPGGTAIGEQIRAVLLNPDNKSMHADTELLLMFAARAQHLRELIEPALSRGVWVVCDRFTDATYAYQGGGRGIDIEKIAVLEKWVQRSLRPDVTFLLDLPVEIGMTRAKQRGPSDRFESEHRAFFDRIRQTYLSRALAEPTRFKTIDASGPLESVQSQIQRVLETL